MLIDVSPPRSSHLKLLPPGTLEGFVLIGVAATAVAGLLWLAARAQLARASESAGPLSRGEIVLLSPGTRTEDLVPAMRLLYPSETEAVATAGTLAEFLRAARPLDHVGALSRALAAAPHTPLLTGAQIQRIKPLLIVRTPDQFHKVIRSITCWFFLPFAAVFLIQSARRQNGGALFLPIGMALTGIGIATLLSIQDPVRDTLRGLDVARHCAAGCGIYLLAASIHFERRTRTLVFPPLVAALSLGVALACFGTGPAGSGVKIGLRILGATMQPSEAIKLLVVFFLAGYLASRWQYLRVLTQDRRTHFGLRIPRRKDLLPLIAGMGMCLLLFLVQKDNGPALIIATLFLALYGVARRHMALVAAILCGAATAAWGIAAIFPSALSTVLARLEIWRNVWDNTVRGGDQVGQALWAFASGGAWGQGLGLGFPQVVPEVYTDMIGAAVAENLGFFGTSAVVLLYALLVWCGFRAAARARGSYECLLALGLAVAFAVQALLIFGGTLGLVPLTGVTAPFLSYGGVSLLVNFAALGIWASIAGRGTDRREELPEVAPLMQPARVVGLLLAAGGVCVFGDAARYQIFTADETSLRTVSTLTRWSAPGAGPQPIQVENPRFAILARYLRRGDIVDRNDLPLATSGCETLDHWRATYAKMGLPVDSRCVPGERHYPLGEALAYTLGDIRRTNLIQSDRQAERRFDEHLRGYASNRDLLVLLRDRYNPRSAEARGLLERDRSVHLTLNGPFQLEVSRIFGAELARRHFHAGAVAVLSPDTGSVLASVSYPLPSTADPKQNGEDLMDRARVGLLPPGSTAKLITDIGLLRKNPSFAEAVFECRRLLDHRAGIVLPSGHAVRDDIQDRPHGAISMREAVVHSCNAWHAAAGTGLLGPDAYLDVASMYNIRVCQDPSRRLPALMSETSYGQGELLVTPFQVARLAGTVAADGVLQPLRWTTAESQAGPVQVLTADSARRLAGFLREVVTVGTGHVLASQPGEIAGKTGTAQRADRRDRPLPSHSWFAGFAPYSAPPSRRIAFAVVVEGGGYGASTAAPIAGRIVEAARKLSVVP